MLSSSHIDASPRTELLSPPSSLTQSQSESSSGRVRPPGGRSRGWRERERELLRNKLSQRELVRLIIDSERESAKLHSTLSNTINLLDEESRKCATLERDTFSNFTRFNTAREAAQAAADTLARDLRVAHFELEHAKREAERLKDEADAQKKFREELEAEYVRMKDMAHKYKRERLMDLARNEGRREGFEAGFQQAQADGYMRRPMKEDAATAAEASAPRRQRPPPPSALRRPQRNQAPVIPSPPRPPEELPFEEMPSIPIVTPPEQTIPLARGHHAPTHTGYSPKRPVPRSRPPVDRSNAVSPSIDHYEVSIPPQHVIEQTTNINQPVRAEAKGDWVTGPQHRDINGQTPDVPAGNFTASSEDRHPHPHVREPPVVENTVYEPDLEIPNERYIQPQGNKSRVKFRRPSLKQAAASWYRTLSFRKKPRQKVVIDPQEGDSGPTSPVTPTEVESAGPAAETSSAAVPVPLPDHRPIVDVQTDKRHSKSASFATSVTRPEGHPPGTGRRHRLGASMDSIPMSAFDMLATPLPTTDAGYPRDAGTANVSSASLVSNGVFPSGKSQAQSISGRSAKSQGNGIGKKLSVIKENPLSRNSTPLRPITQQDDNRAQASRSPQLYKRPSGLEDIRSMRSGRSTGSRMVAVNPDPESPDLVGQGQAPPVQMYSQQPRPGSSLHHYTSGNLPVIAPLRTKKSGLSVTSRGSPLETPTPMPRLDKGKGRELVPPETAKSDGSGIKIIIQTPSDPGKGTPQLGYFNGSRKSSRDSPLSHSTPRLTPSNTISAAQPQDRVASSTPKIFQAQNLPEKGPNGENVFIPRVTIRKRIGPAGVFTVNNAGVTPGLVLHQPLPSHVPQVQQNVGGVPVTGNLGADLAAGLHRAGSSSSLRSQGAYGKFDPNTYQDPAIWGAPRGAFDHDRPRSDTSSRRLSYADIHNEG